MEKQTKADNEVETLNGRWDTVKKVADDRVTKVSWGRRRCWWWWVMGLSAVVSNLLGLFRIWVLFVEEARTCVLRGPTRRRKGAATAVVGTGGGVAFSVVLVKSLGIGNVS